MNASCSTFTLSHPGVLLLLVALSTYTYAQQHPAQHAPKLIVLDPSGARSTPVLNGSPETVSMRSGYVVLAPAQSVGQHSTKANEEALVILSGNGEMRMVGGPTFRLHPFCVAYCPPHTLHNVFNTGSDTLRYIYIVAGAGAPRTKIK